jgi:hypothetical protein
MAGRVPDHRDLAGWGPVQLRSNDPGRFPTLDAEVVVRRGARKLYFLHDGRNAWHSTWVQHHHDGCMHSTWQGAASHAERLRKQGSVFFIHELPAVVLQAESLVLAFTQINTDDVLEGYSPHAMTSEAPYGKQLRDDARNNYLILGSALGGAWLSLEPDSRFWRKRPPPRNSVVRVLAHGGLDDFERCGRGKLKRFRSYSVGAEYLLNWRQSPGGARPRHVNRIARSRPKRAGSSRTATIRTSGP